MSIVSIGIDVGTAYSSVGVFKSSGAEVIANDQGNRSTPGYVSYTEKERLVGEAAQNVAATNAVNTIYDAKRLLGKSFSDAVTQDMAKEYHYEISGNTEDKPLFNVELKGQKIQVTPEEIVAVQLEKMRNTASSYLGAEVTSCVLATPCGYTQQQKDSLLAAAQLANLNVSQLLQEPLAAAIAYGLDKPDFAGRYAVVFDFGSASIKATLLQCTKGIFAIRGHVENHDVGGQELDKRMAKFFTDEFRRKYKENPTENTRAMSRLQQECERVKRVLSSSSSAFIELDALHNGIDFYSNVTRAKLEGLGLDIWTSITNLLDSLMRQCGLDKSNVTHVIMAGGGSHMQRVQAVVKQYFPLSEQLVDSNPEEVFALGCTIQAGLLANLPVEAKNDKLSFKGTSLTIGVECVGGLFYPLIPRQSTLPSVATVVLPVDPSVTSTTVALYQGERPLCKYNHHIASLSIPTPTNGPLTSVRLSLRLGEDGTLIVSAVPNSGPSVNSLINAKLAKVESLNETQVGDKLKDAQDNKNKDNEERDYVMAQINLKHSLSQLKSVVNTKSQVDIDIDQVTQWLSSLEVTPSSSVTQQLKDKTIQVVNSITQVKEQQRLEEEAAAAQAAAAQAAAEAAKEEAEVTMDDEESSDAGIVDLD